MCGTSCRSDTTDLTSCEIERTWLRSILKKMLLSSMRSFKRGCRLVESQFPNGRRSPNLAMAIADWQKGRLFCSVPLMNATRDLNDSTFVITPTLQGVDSMLTLHSSLGHHRSPSRSGQEHVKNLPRDITAGVLPLRWPTRLPILSVCAT